MTLEIRAAVVGDLERMIREDLTRGARAVTEAMRVATDNVKRDQRAQVIGAGLGRRLANTIRSAVFPRDRASLSPSGYVFSRAPRILTTQAFGARIRTRRRRFLAIPTEAARDIRGTDGKRVTPATWPENRFGPLAPVFPRGRRTGLLVARGLVARRGRRGGFRRATVRRATRTQGARVSLTGLTTVPMFVLVRQVTIRPRLDPDRVARTWQGRLPGLIAQRWPSVG